MLATGTLLSSCGGRIQHEYVTRENWSHRGPGPGHRHYHRTRTISSLSWVKAEQKAPALKAER